MNKTRIADKMYFHPGCASPFSFFMSPPMAENAICRFFSSSAMAENS